MYGLTCLACVELPSQRTAKIAAIAAHRSPLKRYRPKFFDCEEGPCQITCSGMRNSYPMPSISQAFVLGAGLGTRLRPLTDDLPKPLVPVFQKPLITFALDHLIDVGVPKFLVNTHHRPERFAETFARSTYRSRQIEFRHAPLLLETAGGIANIADLLSDGRPAV